MVTVSDKAVSNLCISIMLYLHCKNVRSSYFQWLSKVLLYGNPHHFMSAQLPFPILYTFLDFMPFSGSPCRNIKFGFYYIIMCAPFNKLSGSQTMGTAVEEPL
jgi:hypothetical protein